MYFKLLLKLLDLHMMMIILVDDRVPYHEQDLAQFMEGPSYSFRLVSYPNSYFTTLATICFNNITPPSLPFGTPSTLRILYPGTATAQSSTCQSKLEESLQSQKASKSGL